MWNFFLQLTEDCSWSLYRRLISNGRTCINLSSPPQTLLSPQILVWHIQFRSHNYRNVNAPSPTVLVSVTSEDRFRLIFKWILKNSPLKWLSPCCYIYNWNNWYTDKDNNSRGMASASGWRTAYPAARYDHNPEISAQSELFIDEKSLVELAL